MTADSKTALEAAARAARDAGRHEISLPIAPNLTAMRRPTLCGHCRELLAAGMPPETVIAVRRAGTLCFTPATLRHWASLTTREKSDRSIAFAPYDPTLGEDAA